jgi:3'-phosphoadenosine 5'-phosphosulfate sulfotransferase (PAPS reductase)/FAD synthetase
MKYGLAFSGGKDSWACIYLYLHMIEDITVFWVNTGKNYPEALEQINKVKALCPHFIEITSDRGQQNDLNGIPADIVPINWTAQGQLTSGHKPLKVQSYLGCCYDNISKPLNEAIKEHGITNLISGQRQDEHNKSQYKDGEVIDGLTMSFPLENWTKEQVMGYLSERMEIPEHFALDHSSLDCYDCSAYLAESKDRLVWAKKNHPELHVINMQRINQLRQANAQAINALYQIEGVDNVNAG